MLSIFMLFLIISQCCEVCTLLAHILYTNVFLKEARQRDGAQSVGCLPRIH